MVSKDIPPRWDRRMQQRLRRGEAAALGEMYDMFASLVHGLAHRVLGDEQAADALTRDVFVHVWQHPEEYDPRDGPLRTWVAGLAQRLAVRRLRATGAAALSLEEDGADSSTRTRAEAEASAEASAEAEELERRVRRASVAARADYIVNSMPAPLRAALDLAYAQRHDYRRTAAVLGVTEDEARRRLRLGLQLLATAHDAGRPPGNGGAV